MSAGPINVKKGARAKNQSRASPALGRARLFCRDCGVYFMDPMIKVKEALEQGAIPDTIYNMVQKRFPITVSGINRIEKASGIRFPVAYVDPSVIVTEHEPHSYQYGILFARTIPLVHDDRLQVVIQISAPLVAYGLKGTIHAILAHEFLHYLELIRRVSRMEVLSDELTGNLFESVYADRSRLLEPRAVFSDRTLLLHITKRFPSGFRDHKLEDKVVKLWIDKELPTSTISLDSNIAKISADSLAQIRLDPALVTRIDDMYNKSIKIRKKQIY